VGERVGAWHFYRRCRSSCRGVRNQALRRLVDEAGAALPMPSSGRVSAIE
jgi:hypothetical protein